MVADAQSAQESGRTGAGGSSHETGGKYYSCNAYGYIINKITRTSRQIFSESKLVWHSLLRKIPNCTLLILILLSFSLLCLNQHEKANVFIVFHNL